jgi:hypothetical protein
MTAPILGDMAACVVTLGLIPPVQRVAVKFDSRDSPGIGHALQVRQGFPLGCIVEMSEEGAIPAGLAWLCCGKSASASSNPNPAHPVEPDLVDDPFMAP